MSRQVLGRSRRFWRPATLKEPIWSPKPSKIEAQGLQNRGPGLQNRGRSAPKRVFENKLLLKTLRGGCVIRFPPHFGPSWEPKPSQNGAQNVKKSMLKNNTFSASIFSLSGPRFGGVFGRIFGCKKHEDCKNMIFAKTSKIVVFPAENH